MADENTVTAASTSEADGKNTAAQTGSTNRDANGNSASGNEVAEAKTFTQADIDRIVKERLAKAQKTAEQKASDERAETERKNAEEQGNFKTLYESEIKKRESVEAEKAQIEHARLIDRIVSEAKLPDTLRDRLKGETEEELRADAQELAKLLLPETVVSQNGTRVVAQRTGASVPIQPLSAIDAKLQERETSRLSRPNPLMAPIPVIPDPHGFSPAGLVSLSAKK